MLDASQARSGASGAAEANGGTPHAAPGDAAELDLTGEREFLVAETAQDALASMLAPGASVSRVSLSVWTVVRAGCVLNATVCPWVHKFTGRRAQCGPTRSATNGLDCLRLAFHAEVHRGPAAVNIRAQDT